MRSRVEWRKKKRSAYCCLLLVQVGFTACGVVAKLGVVVAIAKDAEHRQGHWRSALLRSACTAALRVRLDESFFLTCCRKFHAPLVQRTTTTKFGAILKRHIRHVVTFGPHHCFVVEPCPFFYAQRARYLPRGSFAATLPRLRSSDRGRCGNASARHSRRRRPRCRCLLSTVRCHHRRCCRPPRWRTCFSTASCAWRCQRRRFRTRASVSASLA